MSFESGSMREAAPRPPRARSRPPSAAPFPLRCFLHRYLLLFLVATARPPRARSRLPSAAPFPHRCFLHRYLLLFLVATARPPHSLGERLDLVPSMSFRTSRWHWLPCPAAALPLPRAP